ncbi:MAG: hypothetical protein O3B13_09530 [Planctomycetota bacterium]|nr:hypothetical protein [Planctomycetota bacterium]
MSIRLCQECCQWVSTRDGRCPDCQDVLPEAIDPAESDTGFRAIVGEVRGRMGHVRVSRRKLPTDGILYMTSSGLFFLPYRSVTRRRLVEQSATSPFWTIAAVLWSPLMFLSPFLRRRELREKDFVEHEPIRLGKDDLQLLPEFLSRVPGAFFVSIRNIRSIRQKRNRWIIDRSFGSSVTIQPIADGPFAQEMQQFLETRL